MKTDDTETTSRKEEINRLPEHSFQNFKLPVDFNPDRLKDTRRRMDPLMGIARRNRTTDQDGQGVGGPDRLLYPGFDNGAGNPPGKALLTIFPENAHQLFFGIAIHNIEGTGPGRSTQTHVQGLILLEGKTPPAGFIMERRDSEIEKNPVDGLHTVRMEGLRHRFEIAADRRKPLPIRSQTLTCNSQNGLILIKGKYPAIGALSGSGGCDRPLPGSRRHRCHPNDGQTVEHLREHGVMNNVHFFHKIPTPSDVKAGEGFSECAQIAVFGQVTLVGILVPDFYVLAVTQDHDIL